MGTGKILKVVQGIAVILSLVIAFWFFGVFDPEFLFADEGVPVGMDRILAAGQQGYTGKTAGSDIPRITSRKEYDDAVQGQYMTVMPQSVVGTGVYSLKPWVDPYSITKGRTSSGRTYTTGRKAPAVTTSPGIYAGYYQEYYLAGLSDGSYIVAQFGGAYAKAAGSGKDTALRIGQKKTNSEEVRSQLGKICGQYGASNEYTLYMVDDEWDEEHSFSLFLIRFGAAAAVFLVLAVGLVMGADRISARR